MLRDATLTVWCAPGAADTIWVQVDGEIADDRSFWAVRASEQRYRRLIHHLPGALLQVDARPMGAVFYQLRAEGVTDIVAHLDAHPGLVEQACAIVRVTDANGGAARLMGAGGVTDLIGPVAFVFARAPETARNVTIAHFEGRRSHALFHLWEVAAGICGPSALVRDFPAVSLPALIGAGLTLFALRDRRAARNL